MRPSFKLLDLRCKFLIVNKTRITLCFFSKHTSYTYCIPGTEGSTLKKTIVLAFKDIFLNDALNYFYLLEDWFW